VRVCVVAPTYQEAENITRFLEAVRLSVPNASVLIVDDNSPDGTGRLADEAAAHLGSAYREGFEWALSQGFDIVVSMDVDFSHDPAVIPQLVGLVERGADAAVGSRYVPGGGTVAWPWHRRMLSRWGNRYTATILRLPVSDCTTGFRAYSAAALRAIDPGSTRAEGYAMLTEFVRRLVRRGMRVVEHPITFVDRQYGTSKMSGRIVAESMLLVTGWGLRDLLRSVGRRGRPQR
jgi:dolichol-phosphate mannosyltransferase